jgi:hypothetical protein
MMHRLLPADVIVGDTAKWESPTGAWKEPSSATLLSPGKDLGWRRVRHWLTQGNGQGRPQDGFGQGDRDCGRRGFLGEHRSGQGSRQRDTTPGEPGAKAFPAPVQPILDRALAPAQPLCGFFLGQPLEVAQQQEANVLQQNADPAG